MADEPVVERNGTTVSVTAGGRVWSGLGLGPDGFSTAAPAGFAGRVVVEVEYVFADGATVVEFIEARGDGTVVPVTDPDRVDITLAAEHSGLLDWLHGPLLVGNLVMDGARMGGDLAAFSTLEGIVSSPRTSTDPAAESVVARLRDLAARSRNG